MSMRIKQCCDDIPTYMYNIRTNGRIDLEQDDYSDLEDVKYCMYCGKHLELEPDPTYRPSPEEMRAEYLKGLNAKDRALEELKDQMDKAKVVVGKLVE